MILFGSVMLQYGCSPDESAEIELNVENGIAADSLCGTCSFVVDSVVTDGELLGILPGQTICLDARKKYGPLVFRNLRGTPESPVYIRNCGGTAIIESDSTFGVKVEFSENIRFLGNGMGAEDMGIRITNHHGYYLTFENFTSDFEVAQIEIAGASRYGLEDGINGFAGIGIKTSPYHDCDLFTDPSRQAWVMRNVSVHNNYIHDTGGEGIYIGHGFYTGRLEPTCPEQTTYSHSIKGLRVYENLIEDVGNDGIQVKNADEDVMVFRNIIKNTGTRNVGAQNEGLFIGEGTTGKFYMNFIANSSGDGCKIQGIGNLDVFKNVIVNPGADGINVSQGAYGVRLDDGYFNIRENFIFHPNGYGFVFYNENGGHKEFSDNTVIFTDEYIGKGAVVELVGNLLTNQMTPEILTEMRALEALEKGLLRFDPRENRK